jgi:OPA family sugar phosphate sensor protein UhpC-like MFS transporter
LTWNPLPRFLRTRPELPRLADPAEVERLYRRRRWSTFLAITVGYSFFYTTRLTLAVAKKPMMDAGLVDAEELGRIGFVLYLTYAFGRLTHGFLADRAHIGRLLGVGLLGSSAVNIAFGGSSSMTAFLVLWGLNGWFQSTGSAPCGANIAAWFGRRTRGTRYSIWSMAQNFGEGIVFVLTAGVVATLGWRWAFWGPGVVCVVVAFALFRFIQDRPVTYGLPPVDEYEGETEPRGSAAESVGRSQLRMLRNPAIWILGLASACMYMTRYGINEWFVLWLQEAKSYDLVQAGAITSLSPIVGIAGTLVAGPVSDRLFGGRRILPSMLYGVLLVAGLVAARMIPPGHPVADGCAVGACGFAIGGLLVFLAGLIAIDISPRRSAGAAMGLVGVFSYLGAAAQNLVSGNLIEAGRIDTEGATTHDFGPVFGFWIATAVLSLALTALLGRMRGAGR